jgi:hypothetical protein
MSDKIMEKQINMKFCVMVGKNANKTSALLTLTKGEYPTKKSSAFGWHIWFKEGKVWAAKNAKDR